MARPGIRSLTPQTIPNTRKIMKLMGTTGLFISGSYFVWQTYTLNRTKNGLAVVSNINKSTLQADENFVELPHHKGIICLPVDSIEAKSELKSMIPKHLRKPWKLLHQANEGDYEQHLSAVRDLAKLGKYLSDGEIRQLAQSSSMRTAIGLARIKNVDLRFFLKPPPLPQWIRDSSVQSLFKQLLRSMPKESVHNCIQFFTTTALENYVPGSDDDLINDIDIGLEFQRDSHHMHSIPRRRYSAETIVTYCLQALLSHSTIESHCRKMIDFSCLPIFQKIVNEFPNSPIIKSIIGKIIANMSLFSETHFSIWQSGWVGLLAQWKQSPNLLITLPATKALCNLDQAFGFTFFPGIYLLLPNDRNVQHKNELSNIGIDVVFVHGLLGGVFYSWRQADPHNERQWGSPELSSSDDYSYCWPRDWLGSESAINDHVRVLGVDFDTYLSQWGNTCPTESFKTSLSERSEDIFQKLKKSGVGRRPVIFVGHSMGGLIIKEMLTKASESGCDTDAQFVKNTKGVIFYSTPHAGSQVAKLSATSKFLFFPSTEVKDLEANSPQLCSLNQSFRNLAQENHLKVISFGETAATPYMGMDFTFVPPRSSNPGYGEFYPVKNVNHMNICKPDNRSSILYRKLINLVWDALDDASPFAI